ncbi:MAG: hypothetical protein ACI4WG_01565 [Erysipelotrichaceae bacterium]
MKTLREEKIEIIDAGYQALDCLNEALVKLNQASGLGVVDILGGGFFASILKREKMKQANQSIEKAKRALVKFNDELDDVYTQDEYSIDTDDFLNTADWLFDNMMVDILVQQRIETSKKNIKEAIDKVQRIIKALERQI